MANVEVPLTQSQFNDNLQIALNITLSGIVKSILSGQFAYSAVTSGYNFVEPYNDLVARAGIANKIPVNIIGKASGITQGVDIWDLAISGSWTAPPLAQTLSVNSNSASDHISGVVGAYSLSLNGLGNNYNLYSETINMSGTAAVLTSGLFTVVHQANVLTAAAEFGNRGNITVLGNTSKTVQAFIYSGVNTSNNGFYQIPSGYTGYLKSVYGTFSNATANASAEIEIRSKLFSGVSVVKDSLYFTNTGGIVSKSYDFPIQFPEKTTIKTKANVLSNPSSNVAVSLGVVLVAN